MTQKNSLMEWMEQTRRVSKSVDIICCETIDAIIDTALPYLSKPFIFKHKAFFDKFCTYYHKDNPVELVKKKKKLIGCYRCKSVPIFVEGSIERCWKGIEMAKVTWMEMIDYLWERPELVRPELLDDYIRSKIDEVCKEKNKRNPLNNGMWEHFGKHWMDGNGIWQEERRKHNR